MKEVNIYTSNRCLSMSDKKPGSYVVKMEYRGRVKYIDGFTENTTSYRVLIIGMIEAIKQLKEPCKINVYNPVAVGFRKIINKKGEYKTTSLKYNGDLLNELSELLSSGGHAIKEHITNEYMKELKLYHKKYDEVFKKYQTDINSNNRCSSNWNDELVDDGVVPF